MEPQLVFGTGSARCGSKSLAMLLGMQPRVAVGHERFLLPWEVDALQLNDTLREIEKTPERRVLTQGNPVQWLQYRVPNASIVGDIAPAYLSYASILIEQHRAKVICLKRDKELTVDSFLRQKFDHCSLQPASGEEPEPKRTASIPKYGMPTRRAAAEAYWEDFYSTAQRLAARYPDQFRIFDIGMLNLWVGVMALLDFVGVPRMEQHIECPDPRYSVHACRLMGGDGGSKDRAHG